MRIRITQNQNHEISIVDSHTGKTLPGATATISNSNQGFSAQYDADYGLTINLNLRGFSPRLIVDTKKKLSPSSIEHIRSCLEKFRSGSGKFLIIEEGMSVYQLVDGRWQPLDNRSLTEEERESLPSELSTS
jgi:hypothetical protein